MEPVAGVESLPSTFSFLDELTDWTVSAAKDKKNSLYQPKADGQATFAQAHAKLQ